MASSATSSLGRLAPAAGAVALWVISMWVAAQGGFVAQSAELAEKFLATIYQGARSLPILLPLWLGIIGIGLPLRRLLAPAASHPISTQLCLGLGAMLMLDWLLAAGGILNAWTAWAACGLGTAVITYHFADHATRQRWHPDHWPSPPWSILLALPAFGLLLVACTIPPGGLWAVEAFAYDVTSYHLEVPREWLVRGQMQSLPNNVYGHLPMFVEAGYMKLAVMHGSVIDAIYSVQFFHASAAVLAAAVLGRFVSSFTGPVAGAAAAALLMATPWTIITGSLAYNEMFVLAFAAAALITLFDANIAKPRTALLLGLFLGLATMSKLTAGGFVAAPIAIALAFRLLAQRRSRRGEGGAGPAAGGAEDRPAADAGAGLSTRRMAMLLGTTALGGALMLAPYLIRNTIWTGNPVFPFAAGIFGSGHWEPQQVERWNKAHHAGSLGEGLEALPRQWLLNTGFGALGGTPREAHSVTDIARFESEYGLPILWIVAAVGAVMMVRHRPLRQAAMVLLIILAGQLFFWLLFTHHQSRFLIPTLLPGCGLAGIGIGRIAEASRRERPWLAPGIAVTLAFCLTTVSFATFFDQVAPMMTTSGELVRVPPAVFIDSLVDRSDVTANQPGRHIGSHPINHLPANSNTLLVGDAGQLIYIERPFLYNTAFDRGLLAELLELHAGNPVLVTIRLAQLKITHVWINFGELNRLARSYGLDSRITPKAIEGLVKNWQRLGEVGGVPVPPQIGLYAIPVGIRIQPNPAEKLPEDADVPDAPRSD